MRHEPRGWPEQHMIPEPQKCAPVVDNDVADGRRFGRVAAIVEVIIVLAIAHVAFRAFKHFTSWGRWESEKGLNYSAGCIFILVAVAMLVLCRRHPAAYELVFTKWRGNLSAGLLCGFLMLAAVVLAGVTASILAVILPLSAAAAAAITPPPIYMVVTVVMLLMLRRDGNACYRCPATVPVLLLLGLLLLPLMRAPISDGTWVLSSAGTLAWFVCSGFGEEIFFRGYMQSRVNTSFGRPFRLLGVDFGIGLLISSFLFGLMHALNTVDYFEGRFEFAWPFGVAAFFAGLFLGLLRERTRSVLAGGVAHGFTDAIAHILRVMAAGG
jgi:membrane protease YdiL (CAAX protease family)